MAAKHDVQHAVSAEVTAARDDVVAACRRAVGTLGKHGTMEANASEITVVILPGMVKGLSSRSPIVYVRLAPAAGGRVRVQTVVGPYRTLQSRVMGFIPAGPKRLVGRSYFFRFLDAFETELAALDPAAGAVHRVAAGSR